MSRKVAVLTDSAASVPPALAHKWGIDVVPLQVIIDGESFEEGEQIGSDGVLEAMNAHKHVSTSQPPVAAFQAAYARAAAAGAEHIVAVLISSTLSGTVNCAQVAAESSPIPVTVVDSRTLAMATGFAAIAAVALAREGADAQAVADEARRVAASSYTCFTVDTLEYLERGGRMPPALATVGRVLNIRPLFEMSEGEVAVAEKVRTTQRAREAVVSRTDAAIARMQRPAVAIMVLGDTELGEHTALGIEARNPGVTMVVRTPVSAIIAAHSGPGALAAVVVDLPARVR